jgi:predicted metalloenzyme YecM
MVEMEAIIDVLHRGFAKGGLEMSDNIINVARIAFGETPDLDRPVCFLQVSGVSHVERGR